jgi:hypothetical protein
MSPSRSLFRPARAGSAGTSGPDARHPGSTGPCPRCDEGAIGPIAFLPAPSAVTAAGGRARGS